MKHRHQVALWAGVATFCTNVVALKAFALIAGGDVRIGLSALATSLCVAGAVYAKQRLDDAKAERDARSPDEPPTP